MPDDAALVPDDSIAEEQRHILRTVDFLINAMRDLNDGDLRSRELSLAITKAEECKHWLVAGWR